MPVNEYLFNMNFKQFNEKKISNLIFNIDQVAEYTFLKQSITDCHQAYETMVNIVNVRGIKSQMRYHLTRGRMATIKNTKESKCCWISEDGMIEHHGRNVNWNSCYTEKRTQVPQRIHEEIIVWARNTIARLISYNKKINLVSFEDICHC